MYRKSIVLLQDKSHAHIVKTVLENRNKDYERDLPPLSDFETLRADVSATRSTAGFRKHLSDFITKNGYPFLVITDYRPDLGLPPAQDPERLALIRSLLVSFSLLASGGPHKNKTLNIVCLAGAEETGRLEEFTDNPSLCLECLQIRDERTLQILRPYLEDPALCRTVFNFHALTYPAGSAVHDGIRKLGEIITAVEQRLQACSEGNGNMLAAEALIRKNLPPANAVFRPTAEKIIINGEIRNATSDEKSRWVESVLYLEGNLSTAFLPKVQQNISLTLAAIPKIKPMKKEAALVLYIPDTSIIDESFAMKMGMYISNVLTRQYRVALRMERINQEKVTNSAGFIALRELLNRPA